MSTLRPSSVGKLYCAFALVGLIGCSKAEEGGGTAAVEAVPTVGSHGGPITALGAGEYLVETKVESKADSAAPNVSFYLLDRTGKKRAVTEAFEMTLNVKQAGKTEEHKVYSQPQTGDPDGKSSRFVATDKTVVTAFETPATEIEMIVAFAAAPFKGIVKAPSAAPTATGTGTAAPASTGTAKPATTATPAPTAEAKPSGTAAPTATATKTP